MYRQIELVKLNRIKNALKSVGININIQTIVFNNINFLKLSFTNYHFLSKDSNAKPNLKIFSKHILKFIYEFNNSKFILKQTDERQEVSHFDNDSLRDNTKDAIKNKKYNEYLRYITIYLLH